VDPVIFSAIDICWLCF